MKTICLLSYERAGTTWLSTVLNTPEIWSIYEIFSRNPTLYYWNFLNMLKRTDCMPKPMIDTFEKIFHPQNLIVDGLSFVKIKKAMIASQPFSLELLKSFQEEAYKSNQMLCFKIFPYHLDDQIKIEDVLNLSDYVVINYRNNLLETFLSWKLAILTGAWTSQDQQDRFAVPKVAWHEPEYLAFCERITQYIDFWKNVARSKPNVTITYEDIHLNHSTDLDKYTFVQNKMLSMGLDIRVSTKNHFQKQRDYTDLSKIINNYDDFLASQQKNIPIYYTH